MKLMEMLRKWMWGRYGMDRLNRFLAKLELVFLLMALFRIPGAWIMMMITIGIVYFRTFSRNISARSAENQKFLQWENRCRGALLKKKSELEQVRKYHIYKCPGCRQKLRIPRGRGKVEIRCTKCGETFIRKS
ncbi:MAG: hypothetical protein J5898_11140 [Lachnospiraceae bacterium]|nr:hypothetical protein [Lachnospiraceae bacterium]